LIWCPKCRYKTVLTRFYDDRCPQCRTVAGPDDVLRKDPYNPKEGQSRHKKSDRSKVFQFDDRPKDPLQSIPTDTLNLYKRDK